jgi:hypothetical protein
LGLRLLSILALIFATVVAWQVKSDFTLSEIPKSASLYFLVAASLRLGVLPIYVPYLTNKKVPYGVSVLSHLAPAISALTLIAYLPGEFLTLSKGLITVLHLFALMAALYASLLWMTRANLTLARPYWKIALSAFVLQSALNGDARAGQAWGLALLLVGSELRTPHSPHQLSTADRFARFGWVAIHPSWIWMARFDRNWIYLDRPYFHFSPRFSDGRLFALRP